MSNLKRWLPIRKLAVAGVGYGLTWGALRLGLDLGSDAANQAAAGLVAGAFAYAEKDPRVVHVLDEVTAEITGATNGE